MGDYLPSGVTYQGETRHETVTVLTWSLDRTVSSNRIQA